MQNFSTNFQFNIAQMNALVKEQDKAKNVGKRQQEEISKKVSERENQHHNTVLATEHQDNAPKIKDENMNEEGRGRVKQKVVARSKKEDEDNILVFKDTEKGNLIDFSG